MATPSLAMVPSGYKDGTLYSVLPNNAGGDFDVTRGSLATRVNKDGLIEPVGTLGADVVLNGDFEETGADQVLNGDFSQESSEVVVNGDFATNSDWSGQKTISGGQLTKNDGSLVYQVEISQNTNYKVIVDVEEVNGTNLKLYMGGTQVDLVQGVQTIYITSGGSNLFNGFNNGDGSVINSISVVEVGQDWSLGDGWSIGDDKAIATVGSTSLVQSGLSIVSGKNYKVTFDVTLDSGSLLYDIGNAPSKTVTQSGNVVSFFVSETTTDIRFFGSTFVGSISNITVEEVGQEWVLTDGVSITAQGARITSTGTSQYIQQGNALVIGDTYEMEYEITESVSGTLSVADSFGSGHLIKNTVGVHSFYGVANNVNLQFVRSGVTDITIDNIKVKRLNGDDTPRIDYTDGGCPVLLTEPQSTNLITQSSDFSDANWVKLQGGSVASAPIVTSNYAISPDGTQNADRVAFNLNGGTASGDTSYISTSISLGTTDATASIYLKTNDGSTSSVTLRLGSGLFDYNVTVTPNWQRFTLSGNTDVDRLQILLYGHQNSNSADLSFYGAQLEELSYATSLIPTYGAVRTRLQDTVFGAGTSSDFNSAEGVLFIESSALANGLTEVRAITLRGSTGNFVKFIYSPNSNRVDFVVFSGGGVSCNLTNVLGDTNINTKFALKWKSNDFAFWINGVKVATDTSGNAPLGDLLSLSLGDESSLGSPFFGKTSQVQVFNTALSDFELQQLTTI